MTSAAKPAPFVIGPDLRAALVAMVRKRVPESEVEDIVQTALAEAIESPNAPSDSESLRRWIFGVAKNKVVDYHRRAGRLSFDMPDLADAPAPHAEADLLRWAERHLPEGSENQKTLDWMLREGEGEKLESIAASEKLPPPRVRQRVSRLRRHFKENWQKEVALLAALGVIVTALVVYVLRKDDHEIITHEVVDPRAEPMRQDALAQCAKSEWKGCLDGLDAARKLDPAGDARPEVQRARQAAETSLKAPAPAPSAAPTGSSLVTPPPESTAPAPERTAPAPESSAPSPKTKPAPMSTETATPIPTPAVPQQGKPQGKSDSFGSDFGSDFGSESSSSGSIKAPAKPAPAKKAGTGLTKGGNSK